MTSDKFDAKAREIVKNQREFERSFEYEEVYFDSDKELISSIANALREAASEVSDVEFQRDEFEKAAKNWMAECDSLKAKYEPLIGVTSKANEPETFKSKIYIGDWSNEKLDEYIEDLKDNVHHYGSHSDLLFKVPQKILRRLIDRAEAAIEQCIDWPSESERLDWAHSWPSPHQAEAVFRTFTWLRSQVKLRSVEDVREEAKINAAMNCFMHEETAREEERAKAEKLFTTIKTISRLLDEHIAVIACEASVYTLSDNDFGVIMHCRDICDEALREWEGK